MAERVLNTWTSPDGRNRARLFQRSDGLFSYLLEAQAYEERPNVGDQGFGYWRTTYRSGLIASFAEAQNNVLAQLSWLANDDIAG